MQGSNEASLYLVEYHQRKTLASLGYRFDPNDLDPGTAEAFILIESEFNRLNNEAMKRKPAGAGAKSIGSARKPPRRGRR